MGGRRKEWVMNVETEEEITFSSKDLSEGQGTQDDPMVIKLDIANFEVHKVLIDNGSSADIIFWNVLKWMNLKNSNLSPVRTPLVGFGGSEVSSMGTIDLPVSMREEPRRRTSMVKFLVVDTPFAYNVILGRPALNLFRVVVSTYHQKMKFPTRNGVGEVSCDTKEARRCYNLSLRKGEQEERLKKKKRKWIPIGGAGQDHEDRLQHEQNNRNIDDRVTKGECRLVRMESMDFRGIDPEVIVHRLNVDTMVRPVKQKKRSFGVERNRIIEEEVNKLKEAGYVSEDPYPLPRIDLLVDSTAGYELFSMMDAYQGYHQIFMAEEDRIKTSFITDRGIYCYNVMPFGLKNAGATYQRLVNKMFKDQIGSTMEVYVDDMLVKSMKEVDHLKDLKQAFGIMRSYGMKLNPSKCTFGVKGGKFLGYMVSERGIEANPEKIEAIAKLQSPRTLKEVQQLTGPEGFEIEVAARLSFAATNNETEYEALILGLQLALEAGARELSVCTDSQLVAMQVEGTSETREQTMIQYLAKVKEQMALFDKCTVQQIPRNENEREDALSKFGAMVAGVKSRKVTITIKECPAIEEAVVQVVEEDRSWKRDLIRYLKSEILSDDPVMARRIKSKAARSGIPRVLISDNRTQFQGKAITAWCRELKIQQNFTAVGNPQANGQSEVTNRTILQHLKTRLEGAKSSWVEELSGVLWAYRTTSRSSTGSDKMPPGRGLSVEESRSVQACGEARPRMGRTFKVVRVKKPGTYKLQDMDDKDLPRPWNIHNLKKFYA
ncbi:UNVERIFIED_CONTAM: Retrovirus-related Pol polyprotein from transposon gypsy [Sesamum latifolium]|uniref:Retrovirus-related Pol polyprotein from transposon gypsy n=1 Tax=Sesamum latifolium TaxID=2727402 RepID=A0AAW2X982_9LAMI